MRESYGVSLFLLGLSIGVVAGIALNRWMDRNKENERHEQSSNTSPISREQIAKAAKHFLQADEKAGESV